MKIETVINRDGSASVISFQRLPHQPGHQDRRKIGFICDVEISKTETEQEAEDAACKARIQAMNGTVEMMASHCILTGESPSLIIDRTEFV